MHYEMRKDVSCLGIQVTPEENIVFIVTNGDNTTLRN